MSIDLMEITSRCRRRRAFSGLPSLPPVLDCGQALFLACVRPRHPTTATRAMTAASVMAPGTLVTQLCLGRGGNHRRPWSGHRRHRVSPPGCRHAKQRGSSRPCGCWGLGVRTAISWTTPKPPQAARRCGVLARFRPHTRHGEGSAPYHYILGPAGAAVVAAREASSCAGSPTARIRPWRSPTANI